MRERIDQITKLKPCLYAEKVQPKRFRGGVNLDPESLNERWQVLNNATSRSLLEADSDTLLPYQKNIENCVGLISMPLGIAGPLRINGTNASGDYLIPLATTEATLVASYHRGCRIITNSGGCNTVLIHEGLSRAPGFVFSRLEEAVKFVAWIKTNQCQLKEQAESTTRFGKLIDISTAIEGNYAYLILDYDTGDAAGQNMVTIATQAVCAFIAKNSPVQPQYAFIESNLSGDKKATAACFSHVRGKKVIAEAVIPNDVLKRMLRTDAVTMTEYIRISTTAAMLSGAIGVTGHYSNALAAIFIACGQDAACVAEASIGITRLDTTSTGDLRISVSLPNLPVGTVGGGTSLPTQKACLDLLKLHGSGHAQAFAEVCAGLCLAGEISLIGALCANEFSRAHQRYARTTT